MVWEWVVTAERVKANVACRLCGRRSQEPTDMTFICARERGGSRATMWRYCDQCYQSAIERAHKDGELRGLRGVIAPDEHLSTIVPAYIVVDGDVLAFFKDEETKP